MWGRDPPPRDGGAGGSGLGMGAMLRGARPSQGPGWRRGFAQAVSVCPSPLSVLGGCCGCIQGLAWWKNPGSGMGAFMAVLFLVQMGGGFKRMHKRLLNGCYCPCPCISAANFVLFLPRQFARPGAGAARASVPALGKGIFKDLGPILGVGVSGAGGAAGEGALPGGFPPGVPYLGVH